MVRPKNFSHINPSKHTHPWGDMKNSALATHGVTKVANAAMSCGQKISARIITFWPRAQHFCHRAQRFWPGVYVFGPEHVFGPRIYVFELEHTFLTPDNTFLAPGTTFLAPGTTFLASGHVARVLAPNTCSWCGTHPLAPYPCFWPRSHALAANTSFRPDPMIWPREQCFGRGGNALAPEHVLTPIAMF